MGEDVPVVNINLLGAPEVISNGKPLRIPRKQLRALFYILAASSKPLTREQLCGLFWADSPDSVARRNLTRLVTLMRRCLPDADILLTDDGQIAFDHRFVWSDVAEFERLSAASHSRPAIPLLTKAIQLYRDSFLQGFSLPHNSDFETWANRQRQIHERQHLANLLSLVDACTAQGDLANAIDYAQRYLAVDDLAEDVHRRLIELFALTGDRSSALRQYERCAAILERELGVSPLPETQAVFRSVLTGARLPSQPAWEEPAYPQPQAHPIPTVGNETALRYLNQAFQRALSGHGNLALIWGEAGIGKSHLLRLFAAHLPAGTTIVHSSCYADTQSIPYQPILQLARAGLEAARNLVEIDKTWLTEISRLLPELHNLYPDLPQPIPLEPEQVRTRLLEALCRLVIALRTPPYPLVLCLDDLHWADTVTLEWLGSLGRRLRGIPVLVVGSYNHETNTSLEQLRVACIAPAICKKLSCRV